MKTRTVLYFTVFAIVVSCISHRADQSIQQASRTEVFDYFDYKDTIRVNVVEFLPNTAYCYSEGIPYALIIGTTEQHTSLPKTISVLAKCDNNTYEVGKGLRIVAIADPTSSTLKPIYFTKDTVIHNQTKKWIIGSQYPATWGKVIN